MQGILLDQAVIHGPLKRHVQDAHSLDPRLPRTNHDIAILLPLNKADIQPYLQNQAVQSLACPFLERIRLVHTWKCFAPCFAYQLARFRAFPDNTAYGSCFIDGIPFFVEEAYFGVRAAVGCSSFDLPTHYHANNLRHLMI